MAIRVTPVNVEKMEFDVTTAEGPCRVTIVTGQLPAVASSVESTSNDLVRQSVSLSALVDPTLQPGQFRKTTATAALASAGSGANAFPAQAQISIDQVEATFDAQSGQTELRVDITAAVANGAAFIQAIAFQVTTLAKL